MAVEIKVPELGESVIEATVGRWLKKEGDSVKVGEAVVEIETDKVNLEVGAEKAGVLVRILRKEGEDVKVGDALGVVEEVPQAPGSKPDSLRSTQEAPRLEPVSAKAEPERAPTSQAVERPTVKADEKVTPIAKRMADDLHVDLSQVPPSGPGGRVTKGDVQRFAERKPDDSAQGSTAGREPDKARTETPPVAPTPPSSEQIKPAPPPPEPQLDGARREERVRMSRRRRTIARRLVEGQHAAAMLTTFNEVDMGAIMELRERRKEEFKQRHNVSLGISSFFVKAAIGALKAFPRLNAEVQGDDMIIKHYYDIGVAIGDEEGLVVPVLRDADRMTFAEIEKKIKQFAQQAKDGALSLEDLRGGTFTITNGGVYGSLMSTPILNPPQVGILGLHKIMQRPVVLNGQIVARQMMYVALSYDHRIVDGQEAVQFLVRIKELAEDPATLLLEG
jgi:2-oxoglutarate dehydrogenase E2 component (dihydrolipoamide succinyltransferase)